MYLPAVEGQECEDVVGDEGEFGRPMQDMCKVSGHDTWKRIMPRTSLLLLLLLQKISAPGSAVRFCKAVFPALRRLLRERMRAQFEARRRFRDQREEDDDDVAGPPRMPFSPDLTEDDFGKVERVSENFQGQCYICPGREDPLGGDGERELKDVEVDEDDKGEEETEKVAEEEEEDEDEA